MIPELDSKYSVVAVVNRNDIIHGMMQTHKLRQTLYILASVIVLESFVKD